MPGHYGNGNGNGNRTTPTTRATSNDNPVIRLFNAPTTPRYYRPNGTIVPIGAKLHEHQDGTIMTEHSMDGVGADASVVVTTLQNTRTINIGNNNSLRYVFADTGEPYSGRVVNIGGIHYSTDTGTKQGNSREVVIERVSTPTNVNLNPRTNVANRPNMSTMNGRNQNGMQTSNINTARRTTQRANTRRTNTRRTTTRGGMMTNRRTTRRTTGGGGSY